MCGECKRQTKTPNPLFSLLKWDRLAHKINNIYIHKALEDNEPCRFQPLGWKNFPFAVDFLSRRAKRAKGAAASYCRVVPFISEATHWTLVIFRAEFSCRALTTPRLFLGWELFFRTSSPESYSRAPATHSLTLFAQVVLKVPSMEIK